MKKFSRAQRATLAIATCASIAFGGITAPIVFAQDTATTCADNEAIYSVSAGTIDWNVRTSFVRYIHSMIARGGTSVNGVVETGTGQDKTWTFSGTSGEVGSDAANQTITFGTEGSLRFFGHGSDDAGWKLDLTMSNLRLEAVGTELTMIADVESREFIDTTTLGEMQTFDDVRLASWTLAAPIETTNGTASFSSNGDGQLTAEGLPAFGGFYDADNAAVAPISGTITFDRSCPAPVIPVGTPEITVDKVELSPEGEHIVTVTGTGFQDPSVVGTRPPLLGTSAGVYVVFGRFADQWQPSTGAPSSSRVTSDMKWAVPAESMGVIGGPARGAIELQEDGSFTATIKVSKEAIDAKAATGNYGIYTYPGSGAVHAAWETYTPITFTQPAEPTTTAPEPTTSAPEPTTSAPEPTTSAPEPTTSAPEPTTSAPEPTTSAPEPTTSAPEPTTSAPEPTTSAPEPTTSAPEPTTSAPEPTTSAPEPTTSAPEPTTSAPEPTTTAAPTTSAEASSSIQGSTGAESSAKGSLGTNDKNWFHILLAVLGIGGALGLIGWLVWNNPVFGFGR